MIHIDYQDKRPLYEQLIEKFKELIIRGVLNPDDKIPSVRNLAIDLSINPNTIQRAYLELERMGFIYTVKGRGNYVAEKSKWENSQMQELYEQFDALTSKLKSLGFSEEDLKQHVTQIFRKEDQA